MAAQVVLTPFVLYFVTRQAAEPQFQTFDPLSPPLLLPPSYAQNIAQLEAIGFHTVAHLFGAALTTRVRAVLTLFVNQSEKDRAMVAHMLAENPPIARLAVNYVEFFTHFEDVTEVSTANSKQMSAFVEVPEKKIFRLPDVTEPRQLYVFHRAMLAQRSEVNKRLPTAGDEVSDLVRTMQRDMAREASFGRMRLDDSGLWYRLTMKGAILYSLKFGWPVGFLRRQIQRWRGKGLAHAVLKDQ
jgi:hypothetical protein